jgi:lysophospholipase L1-like esterase
MLGRLSLTFGVAFALLPAALHAQIAPPSAPACSAPPEVARLDHALTRTARRLVAREPLTIVAIGSSSTAGAGASSPDATYPSRLAVELRERFPGRFIKVLNKGVNGEDAREMIARFAVSVIAEQPDLVLWQVGTNALLLDRPLERAGGIIREGLRRLKEEGVDVVLIDAQFAPKVLAKADIGTLMGLYGAIAKEANVGVFHRFAVMQHWREQAGIPFEMFLSPDELHMNDWSYACIAKLLAGSIAEAVSRATLTADRFQPRR